MQCMVCGNLISTCGFEVSACSPLSSEYINTPRLAHYLCIDHHQAGKISTETNIKSILQSTAAIYKDTQR